MKTRARYLEALIVLLIPFMVGCACPLTMEKIQFVERGMPSGSLSSLVGQEPETVFTVAEPGIDRVHQVQVFPMQTGRVYLYYHTYSKGTLIPWSYTYPVSEDYAFLFRDDSLIYWGFLHEFARSDEEPVRRLAPLIMEGLKKEKEKGR